MDGHFSLSRNEDGNISLINPQLYHRRTQVHRLICTVISVIFARSLRQIFFEGLQLVISSLLRDYYQCDRIVQSRGACALRLILNNDWRSRWPRVFANSSSSLPPIMPSAVHLHADQCGFVFSGSPTLSSADEYFELARAPLEPPRYAEYTIITVARANHFSSQ